MVASLRSNLWNQSSSVSDIPQGKVFVNGKKRYYSFGNANTNSNANANANFFIIYIFSWP